jgi:hypothetical protein
MIALIQIWYKTNKNVDVKKRGYVINEIKKTDFGEGNLE